MFKQVSHAVFYEWDSGKKENYMKYVERKIIREKNSKPLFFKMLQIAKKTIEHYESDFYVHDYNRLTIEKDSKKYAWIVYNCGSHLIRLDNDFKNEMENSIDYFDYLKRHREKTAKAFIIDLDNESLKPVEMNAIKADHFTYEHETHFDYFNKATMDMDIDKKIRIYEKMKQILSRQRGYISKKQIDDLLKLNRKNSKIHVK